MASTKQKLSLLDTIISLPMDPGGIMKHLLVERRYPPFLVLTPLSTFAVLVVPTIWYQYYSGTRITSLETRYAITVTAVLTLVGFSLLMSVLFRVLLLRVSPGKLWAASLYSLAGLTPFMLAFYLGNFLTSGHLSVLPFLASGHIGEHDWFLRLFPLWAKVALCAAFLIFVHAIRALTNVKFLSALSMSVLAIPVLIGSFVVSLTIAEAFFHDTGVQVYRFFTHLLSSAH